MSFEPFNSRSKRIAASAGLGGLLLLIAAGWVVIRRAEAAPEGFPYGDLKSITLQGSVIDLNAVLAGKYGARIEPGAPRTRALATPEGRLYTFFDNGVSRRLAESAPNRAVEVKARHLPRTMVLELTEFRDVDPNGLRRKFHCPVCNIDSEDWGPCPCCGKEYQPVEPAPKTPE